jgi:hypothetical protein
LTEQLRRAKIAGRPTFPLSNGVDDGYHSSVDLKKLGVDVDIADC